MMQFAQQQINPSLFTFLFLWGKDNNVGSLSSSSLFSQREKMLSAWLTWLQNWVKSRSSSIAVMGWHGKHSINLQCESLILIELKIIVIAIALPIVGNRAHANSVHSMMGDHIFELIIEVHHTNWTELNIMCTYDLSHSSCHSISFAKWQWREFSFPWKTPKWNEIFAWHVVKAKTIDSIEIELIVFGLFYSI